MIRFCEWHFWLWTHLVKLGCWIARLRCSLCTADDCRDSPKTRCLQHKTTNQLAFQCVKIITPHMQSFLVIQSRMQFEERGGWRGGGGGMIVIAVQPAKQVIYFFFISLKLCNTEQYRMWHWRLLFLVPFQDISPFSSQYIPKRFNKQNGNKQPHAYIFGYYAINLAAFLGGILTPQITSPPPHLFFSSARV